MVSSYRDEFGFDPRIKAKKAERADSKLDQLTASYPPEEYLSKSLSLEESVTQELDMSCKLTLTSGDSRFAGT